jgi:hypothetical protein
MCASSLCCVCPCQTPVLAHKFIVRGTRLVCLLHCHIHAMAIDVRGHADDQYRNSVELSVYQSGSVLIAVLGVQLETRLKSLRLRTCRMAGPPTLCTTATTSDAVLTTLCLHAGRCCTFADRNLCLACPVAPTGRQGHHRSVKWQEQTTKSRASAESRSTLRLLFSSSDVSIATIQSRIASGTWASTGTTAMP